MFGLIFSIGFVVAGPGASTYERFYDWWAEKPRGELQSVELEALSDLSLSTDMMEYQDQEWTHRAEEVSEVLQHPLGWGRLSAGVFAAWFALSKDRSRRTCVGSLKKLGEKNKWKRRAKKSAGVFAILDLSWLGYDIGGATDLSDFDPEENFLRKNQAEFEDESRKHQLFYFHTLALTEEWKAYIFRMDLDSEWRWTLGHPEIQTSQIWDATLHRVYLYIYRKSENFPAEEGVLLSLRLEETETSRAWTLERWIEMSQLSSREKEDLSEAFQWTDRLEMNGEKVRRVLRSLPTELRAKSN